MRPRVGLVDDCFAVGRWKSVFIQIWEDEPTEERARMMRLEAKAFLASTKEPISALIVVGRKCPVPNDASKLQSSQFLVDIEKRAERLAFVLEGEGFIAAAARLTMLGILAASRVPFQYKVLHRTDFASAYLTKTHEEQNELIAAIDELRGAVRTEAQSRRGISRP